MIEWIELATYLGLWILFGLIHSLFASDTMKSFFPLNSRPYRIIYNIFAGLIFVGILYFLPSITSIFLRVTSLSVLELILFLIISGLGLIITTFGLLKWNLSGFIGLTREDDPLITKGIYALSRHPVYTGIMLIFLSTLVIEVSSNSLSWLIGGGGYFVLGSIFEENKLKSRFPEYQEYEKNVGRFFPWKKRHLQYFLDNK